MIQQFKILEDFILKLRNADEVAKCRNALATLGEQVEAYQKSSDEQDSTLKRQADTIVQLQNQVRDLEARLNGLTRPRQERAIDDYPYI